MAHFWYTFYMPTTKKRVNISMSPWLEKALGMLAKRDSVPEATKASELLQIAIEIEEDLVFNSIASGRDTKNAKFFSHKKAWA